MTYHQQLKQPISHQSTKESKTNAYKQNTNQAVNWTTHTSGVIESIIASDLKAFTQSSVFAPFIQVSTRRASKRINELMLWIKSPRSGQSQQTSQTLNIVLSIMFLDNISAIGIPSPVLPFLMHAGFPSQHSTWKR